MHSTFQNLLLASTRLVAVGCLLFSLMPFAHANEVKSVTGLAVITDTKHLQINGQTLALWGIDPLAQDQQCWQEDAAWACGEEALMALKHFADGKLVRCELQSQADTDGPAFAKCYRVKGQKELDISEQMIRKGWALDLGVQSGGAYYAAEQEAQSNKRGAWQGRFQTAQDWRDGVQRFVGEEDAAAPETQTGQESE